ncbi:MAG: UDP-3-O-acyl-N-acetylglucosamine deacetylase [Desulfobulbaceae bacterium]|nr:UDP-3-O-acyl-N-acetylglucosamine deacetylase [Desulfobulbaceae bacterium]
MELFQYTIKKKISLAGIGLHTGEPVNLTIKPAAVDTGIRFVRLDLGQESSVPAFMNRVVDTSLATTIAEDETAVSTTEHLLGALAGLGVDNAVIELDGAEVPIMDGSAGPFVHLLEKVERRRQKAAKKVLKIVKEIVCSDGDKLIRVLPYDGLKVTCEIDFAHEMIGKQTYTIDVNPQRFAKEIASARTFGFMDEVKKLKEHGYALGGSLDNAVVVDQLGVLNKDGLRFADEFVRHKVLDLIGDLALLGCPMMGHVIASKSGHEQHLRMMQAIANNPDCWQFVRLEQADDDTVLERVITTTKAAGNKILPFLAPPATPFVGGHCAA